MAKNKKHIAKKQIGLIVLGVTIIVGIAAYYVLSDIYVNGSEYRKMVHTCGTKNLTVGEKLPKDPTPRYRTSSDPNYRIPFPNSHYFCTEQDAKDAGYLPLYNPDGTYNQDY